MKVAIYHIRLRGELNPVNAGLASKPELWKYSSPASHVYGKEDLLLSITSLLNEMIYSSSFDLFKRDVRN